MTPTWLLQQIPPLNFPGLLSTNAAFYHKTMEICDPSPVFIFPQLISDAGFQGEIGNVSTACHEIEVFSKVMQTSITKLLEGGEEAMLKHLPEFSVSRGVVILQNLTF